MSETRATNTHDEAATGICLSGGGFRAALYGLGVLRYMAEAGQLERAAVICGVSGGSILASAVVSGVAQRGGSALRADFVSAVYDPFVKSVTERDLRNEALGRWAKGRLTLRGRPRNLVMADVLAEALFPAVETLSGLPVSPQVVITATELQRGHAFRFSRDFIGSYDYGYAQPPAEMRLATAVSASTAAPPALPALQLPTSALGLKDAPPRLSVTDGGVYDNLGLEWIQGWSSGRPAAAKQVEDVVVVNASGHLRPATGAQIGPWALNRSRQIQYTQTQSTRIRWFVQSLLTEKRRGMYLGVVNDPRKARMPDGTPVDPSCHNGALPSELVMPLSELRTDLNRFSDAEAQLLAYHGYWCAANRWRALRPDDAVSATWTEFANMSGAETRRYVELLSGRSRRIGIAPTTR